jgi:subfamily B ATP-binding cassette protein MsbA
VDLTLRRGSVTALVGPSGAGKSTLAALLPRFMDPTAGRVTLDGIDLRDVTLASLRARIGLVTQDVVLFDDTVRRNVAYGRPDAKEADVREALAAANALAFVDALPEGLDTRVGEGGARLSGGQRQRLAIARALLKDPPILVLDEATSALDAESERAVQEALVRLMAGRTVLVIAHRLSTVRRADQLAVLDAGRIVETGRHADLLAAGGLYRRLHDLQAFDAPRDAAQAEGSE